MVKNILELPKPKKLVGALLNQNIPEIQMTISQWLHNEMNDLEQSRRWTRDRIFMTYANALLARQSYQGWFDKVLDWFNNEIILIDNLPSAEKISIKLKEFGYRWHPQGGNVIKQAKEVLKLEYNYEWEKYFTLADANYRDGFLNDPFLEIRNVGFKVRDLALSHFSPKYVAIDEHVVEVIKRTGLICYAYPFGLEMTTDQSNDYPEIRNLCVQISEMAEIEPRELDRLFWLHGKYICKGRNKKCNNCVVNYICLTYLNKPNLSINK